jgi:hypothetical protein
MTTEKASLELALNPGAPTALPHPAFPHTMMRAVSIRSARSAWASAASFIGVGILVAIAIPLVARVFSRSLDSEDLLSGLSQGSIGAMTISITDPQAARKALLAFMALAGVSILIQISAFVSGIVAASTSRTYLGAGMSRPAILLAHTGGAVLAALGIAAAAFILSLGAMAVEGTFSGDLHLPAGGTLEIVGIAANSHNPLPMFWWIVPVLAVHGGAGAIYCRLYHRYRLREIPLTASHSCSHCRAVAGISRDRSLAFA